jgi:clan AA aspartic protease (TIGR02281 family)
MQKMILLAMLLAPSLVQAESIPLIHESGTYQVPVLINDKISLNFTVDSGAADVSIPADVFSTLSRTGTITNSDLMDKQVYELADGSEHRSQRFRIRSLRVGNLELHNVVGSVAPSAGSLLLGQSFLERLDYWSFDNQRHLLIVNEAPSSVSRSLTTRTTTAVSMPSPNPSANEAFMSLKLPAGWVSKTPTGPMTKGGWLEYAQNQVGDIQVALNPINGTLDFGFVRQARSQVRLNMTDEVASEISEIWIAGRRAYRFSVTGKIESGETYTVLHTYIGGSRAIAHVITWTPASNFENQKEVMAALSEYVVGFQ